MRSQDSAHQTADGDFDILNMSWGAAQNTLSPRDLAYETQLRFAAVTKRRGLGTIFVKAAGNHFLVPCRNRPTQFCTGNSNFDADDANPYTIMVSSLAPNGSAASYSSPGSNIWVSAMGGETGVANAAMITTDRAGCARGNSRTNATSTLPFERGGSGNTNCNYSATFTGTSAAAPVTSGAIALLLEANPNLSWRDIKYLLARTAVPVDFQTNTPIPHPLNNALPAGGSSTLTVNTSLRIEAAQIQLWVTHPDISELAIELTSPSGTRSLIVNMHNSLVGLPNYQGELMMTNAFYQENSQGTWTLKVIDGKFNQTGTLTRWRLNLVGGN